MKDAKGHGSEKRTGRVAHQVGVNAATQFGAFGVNKIQGHNPDLIGKPWATEKVVEQPRPLNAPDREGNPQRGGSTNQSAKAERIAQFERTDRKGSYQKTRGSTPNPVRVR